MTACKHKNKKSCAMLEFGVSSAECGLINSDFCRIHQLSSDCLTLKSSQLIKIQDEKSRSRSAAIFLNEVNDRYALIDLETLISTLSPGEGVLKADKLFIQDSQKSNGIIVELKGIDLDDAVGQVKASLDVLRRNQVCADGVSALIVFTVNKTPNFDSFRQTSIRAFRNKGGKSLQFKASSTSQGKKVVNGHKYQDFF